VITQEGIDFIKRHEGFSNLPYLCSAGKETIGYGHVIKTNEQFPCGLTEEMAEEILYDDLAIAEQAIFDYVEVDLRPFQFDALVSFIFNIGVYAF
jgi:Phage-related lysozyme (muraminidase)